MVRRYITRRKDSRNWMFEMRIPEDVQKALGQKKIRRSTGTDSEKIAQRQANIWAEEIQTEIDAARGTDWDLHKWKKAVGEERAQGTSEEDIFDFGLYAADSKDDVRNFEIAMGRIVILADHTEPYLQYCADEKLNKLKTLQSKRVYVEDFANSFRTLGDVTQKNVVHWTDKNNHWKSATQRVVQAHTRGFLKYISERVIFEKIDLSVLDSITTKRDVSKSKDVLTKEAFRQAEARADSVTRDAMRIMAYTGRRGVSVANLRAEDVVYIENILCFRFATDKNRRSDTHPPQIIPVHSKIIDRVKELKDISEDGYLIALKTMSDEVEARADKLQRMIAKTGITGHQFRTTVITMLAQTEAKESHSRAIVGHQVGKQDVHEKSYVKLRTPSTLQATVEMIDWDNWVWSEYW